MEGAHTRARPACSARWLSAPDPPAALLSVLRICLRPDLTAAGLEKRLLCARQPRSPGSPPHLAHGGPLPVHPGRVLGRDGAADPPGPPAGAAAPPQKHPPSWHPPGSPAQLAPGGPPSLWDWGSGSLLHGLIECTGGGAALCGKGCLPRWWRRHLHARERAWGSTAWPCSAAPLRCLLAAWTATADSSVVDCRLLSACQRGSSWTLCMLKVQACWPAKGQSHGLSS